MGSSNLVAVSYNRAHEGIIPSMLILLTMLACSDPPPSRPEVKPPPVEKPPPPEPVVINQPPKVSKFTITPTKPNTSTTLDAVVDASDPDGGVVDVDYQWSVNGSVLLTENRKRLESRNFERDDVVSLKVAISDGETTVERSARLTIGNASPIFISDPRNVRDINGFRLSVNDPDGDKVKYRIEGAPKGMAVDASQGVISYEGSVDEPGGEYNIRIIAEDPDKAKAVWEFSVNISAGSPGTEPESKD